MFEFLDTELSKSQQVLFKKLVSLHLSSLARKKQPTELVKRAVSLIDTEAKDIRNSEK